MSNLRDLIEDALDALERGDTGSAIAFFDSNGRTPPEELGTLDKGKFWELAGNLAMAQDRHEDALEAYEHMLRYERRGGECKGVIGNSHGKVGGAHAAIGHHEKAVDSFRRGIEMLREDEARATYIATLNFHLAESLMALERFREAAKEYRATIGLAEKEPDARSLGFLHYRLAMSLEPMALLEQTVRQVHALADELRELGADTDEMDAMLEQTRGKGTDFSGEAKVAYRHAITWLESVDDPSLKARVHRDFAKLLRADNDTEGASTHLESALEYARESGHRGLRASILYETGENEFSSQNYLAAISAYADVLELQAGWEASALQGASRAALEAGEEERAIAFAEQAVGLLSDDPERMAEAFDNLARICDAAGLNSEADEARVNAEEARQVSG